MYANLLVNITFERNAYCVTADCMYCILRIELWWYLLTK